MKFIGHNNIRERFKRMTEKNALSHAHLIIGPDGIGKSLIANEFAFAILNIPYKSEHIDVVHYKAKKLSFGVDAVREIISECNKKPYEGDKKIIILHNGEKFTLQAQNALLKTIEEPPKGVFIIILSESSEVILDTIKSRCQIHKLSQLSRREIEEYIELNHKYVDYDRDTLVAFSEGIPGRIEKFLKDESFSNIRDLVVNLLIDITSYNDEVALKYSDAFNKIKGSEQEVLAIMVSFIRDIIIFKEINDKSLIINGDKIRQIEVLANSMSHNKLNSLVKIVDETRENLNSNTNLWLSISTMLIKMLED